MMHSFIIEHRTSYRVSANMSRKYRNVMQPQFPSPRLCKGCRLSFWCCCESGNHFVEINLMFVFSPLSTESHLRSCFVVSQPSKMVCIRDSHSHSWKQSCEKHRWWNFNSMRLIILDLWRSCFFTETLIHTKFVLYWFHANKVFKLWSHALYLNAEP